MLLESTEERTKESMIKPITIGNKTYQMKSNMGIYDAYKNIFGVELGKDIDDARKMLNKVVSKGEDDDVDISALTQVINKCTNIAWVMIHENDKTFKSLAEWKEELDDGMLGAWCSEVLALAFYPFRTKSIPQDHKPPQQ